MKIWTAEYKLTPSSTLNAVASEGVRSGFLLKVEWALGLEGYSDVFPWPEFGDPSISDLLESLREKNSSNPLHPLLLNSLIFNREDARARKAGQSLFAGHSIPESHSLGVRREEGFRVFKLKMKNAVLPNLDLRSDEKIRLDFNGCLTISEFLKFWQGLDQDVKGKIDLIEDPWSEVATDVTAALISETVDTAIPLASDFYSDLSWKHRVVKPARVAWNNLKTSGRIIFTHSMDHPVGQAFALWCASLPDFHQQKKIENKNEIHGVSPSKNYVPNEFHDFWCDYTPKPNPPKGLGIGFDDVLKSQKWEEL